MDATTIAEEVPDLILPGCTMRGAALGLHSNVELAVIATAAARHPATAHTRQ
jgi:hypothetical protein